MTLRLIVGDAADMWLATTAVVAPNRDQSPRPPALVSCTFVGAASLLRRDGGGDVVSIYDTGLHALVCDSLRGPLDIVRLPSRRVRWFGGSACVCRADS